jgi:hypothetical protein
MIAAAALWLADTLDYGRPLFTLPLVAVLSVGFGYGDAAYAVSQSTRRCVIVTSDCYYKGALAFPGRTGIFVVSDGQTAFHPKDKVHSMLLVRSAGL